MASEYHPSDEEEDILAALIGHIDEEEARENEPENRVKPAQLSTTTTTTTKQLVEVKKPQFTRQPAPSGQTVVQKRLLENVKVPQRSATNHSPLNENFRPFADADQNEDKVLGIRVSNRKLSRVEVAHNLFGRERNVIEFKNLVRLEEEDFDNVEKFGTVAVVGEVSETLTSAKTKMTFRYWTITDLRGCEIRVVFFGEAYKTISGHVPAGSVVAVLDPKFESRRSWESDRFENSLIVYRPNQIVCIGMSPVFARCQDPDCIRACDKSISPYCAHHARDQLRILAANRMDLNSSGGAFNLITNPYQHMPQTRREARLLVKGISRNEECVDEKKETSTQRIQEPEVSRVDARAFMSEVIQGQKRLSAAQVKVAQALKLIPEQTKTPSTTLGIPTVPAIPPLSTKPASSAQGPRPLGSGLVLKRHARDVKLAQDISKRLRS